MNTYRVFHNLHSSFLSGYVPGNQLTEVAVINATDLDDVFFILNVAHEAEFNADTRQRFQAVKYRERKNRSLSVGDVILDEDGVWWSVESVGFRAIEMENAPLDTDIVNLSQHGTTYIGIQSSWEAPRPPEAPKPWYSPRP